MPVRNRSPQKRLLQRRHHRLPALEVGTSASMEEESCQTLTTVATPLRRHSHRVAVASLLSIRAVNMMRRAAKVVCTRDTTGSVVIGCSALKSTFKALTYRP